jgi:hypothetical protein
MDVTKCSLVIVNRSFRTVYLSVLSARVKMRDVGFPEMWALKCQAKLRNLTEERRTQSNVYKIIILRPFDVHFMYLAQIYKV